MRGYTLSRLFVIFIFGFTFVSPLPQFAVLCLGKSLI